MISAEEAHKLGIAFSYAEYCEKKDNYQIDGEYFLVMRKHAFLYYEPGKGKTYPAIAAIREVAMDGKVLILSTADSVRQMWEAEIVPQDVLPTNTVIMSFTKAIQDKVKPQLLSVKWDVILVDESHKVKSNTAQISKLLHKLTRKVPYVWGLSGTPRGNSELDIFCQFHNLNVADWGDITYTQFINTCCDVEKQYGPYGMFTKVLGINDKYRAGWERNVAMYTQRVSYEEGEMPELDIQEVKIKYEKTELYKNALQGVIMLDDFATTMTKLVAINKCQQICNGFVYYTDEVTDEKQTYVAEHALHNYKIDYLKEHIHKDEPVVVVYLFAQDLANLRAAFPQGTEDIAEFKRGQSNLLFLQCSRCESFNLQRCKFMYFYTMDCSYIKFKQMMHRIYRRGQEDKVTIRVLVHEDTIEENIWKIVKNKKSAADLFMAIKEGA